MKKTHKGSIGSSSMPATQKVPNHPWKRTGRCHQLTRGGLVIFLCIPEIMCPAISLGNKQPYGRVESRWEANGSECGQ